MKKQNNVRALSVRNTRENLPNCAPKTNKGITLIALIITIIVLLILAIVSIRLVMNDGILGKAESGVSKYQEAEANEQAQLLKAEYEMAKYEGKATGTFTDYVLETKYNGAKIGDYVAYNEAGFGDYTTDTSKGIGGSIESYGIRYTLTEKTYTKEDLGWRVLGVNEKGELELISDNPMSEEQKVYLANEEGYLYGPEELNKMCNTLYGNGTGSTGKVVATGARSLNVDDIDKLAGITTEEQKKKINSGYGVEWTYRYPTQEEMDEYTGTENSTRYMQYSTDGGTTWNNIASPNSQTFRMPGQSITISVDNPGSQKLTNTNYNYSISEKLEQTTSDGKSMADIIVKVKGIGYVDQWLASQAILGDKEYAYFGVFGVGSWINRYDLYATRGHVLSGGCCVRPVISLSTKIQLSGSSESGWTIN